MENKKCPYCGFEDCEINGVWKAGQNAFYRELKCKKCDYVFSERKKTLEKTRIFKEIKILDAEIRTLQDPTEDFKKYIVEVGLFESLGEQGGDILTLTYEKYPTDEEIKNDIKDNLKETFEDLKDSNLGYREEKQLEILEKLNKKQTFKY